MNDQDHSLSLSDPDRSLVLSHLLTKTDYDPDRSLVLSHLLTFTGSDKDRL
jgi:hypothetical protein